MLTGLPVFTFTADWGDGAYSSPHIYDLVTCGITLVLLAIMVALMHGPSRAPPMIDFWLLAAVVFSSCWAAIFTVVGFRGDSLW